MRLVTRSDFDGLICAALLKKVEQIDSIQFVHPKDLQDGAFAVTSQDILANVPYVAGCGMWFDHHSSEIERVVGKIPFKGDCRLAPSAARVVYDFYGGAKKFPRMEEMMLAVDKADSAQFTADEILHPSGWNLLSFVMDARTGLGRYKDYRISNYQLMYKLIDECTSRPIDQILQLPDVAQRLQRYIEHDGPFRGMLHRHSRTEGDVVVTDLRGQPTIHCGTRFMIYALHPQQNCSIWIVDGRENRNTVFACGHSIINKTCQVDIGALMRRYEGGGHRVAGTCQVPNESADKTLAELVQAMRGNQSTRRVPRAA